jgi:hypothetical protein
MAELCSLRVFRFLFSCSSPKMYFGQRPGTRKRRRGIVLPFSHLTTKQHNTIMNKREKKKHPLEQSSANNPRFTQARNKETRTTNSHAQQTQIWSTTNIIHPLPFGRSHNKELVLNVGPTKSAMMPSWDPRKADAGRAPEGRHPRNAGVE